jgi:hypothetical protein
LETKKPKTMIKSGLISIILLFFISPLMSQGFERQIGVRSGYTSGISGKVIKDDKVAIAGMFGFRQGGMQLVVLLESYHPLIPSRAQEWRIYFGGGGHVGWVNGYNRVRRWSNSSGYYWEERRLTGPVFGLDAVFGTEYNFVRVPLALFAEFKPFVEFQSFKSIKVNFYDFGVGIRYKFGNN